MTSSCSQPFLLNVGSPIAPIYHNIKDLLSNFRSFLDGSIPSSAKRQSSAEIPGSIQAEKPSIRALRIDSLPG